MKIMTSDASDFHLESKTSTVKTLQDVCTLASRKLLQKKKNFLNGIP